MAKSDFLPTAARELAELINELGAPNEFRRMQLGLERITALCSLLGDPQKKFTAIQIVGTNGKGSTTFYLSQMVQRGIGLKVGSFFSPHLINFNERIRINGQPVGDEELLAALKKVVQCAGQLQDRPTFFEVVTAAALEIFAQNKIDLAVLEAGLGGRLDATSVCQARWGIITEVALDHCHILGHTIAEIMAEKLAAFTRAEYVLSAPQLPEGHQFLQKYQLSKGQIEELTAVPACYSSVVGAYRRRALAVAQKMAERVALSRKLVLDKNIWQQIDINFPGRLQFLQNKPPVIADISHNPAAISAMLAALAELPADKRKWLLVFGAMQDKDIAGVVELLIPHVATVYLPRLEGKRAAAPEDLAKFWNIPFTIFSSVDEAVRQACSVLASENYRGLLICGSNFVAGPAVAYFTDNK